MQAGEDGGQAGGQERGEGGRTGARWELRRKRQDRGGAEPPPRKRERTTVGAVVRRRVHGQQCCPAAWESHVVPPGLLARPRTVGLDPLTESGRASSRSSCHHRAIKLGRTDWLLAYSCVWLAKLA